MKSISRSKTAPVFTALSILSSRSLTSRSPQRFLGHYPEKQSSVSRIVVHRRRHAYYSEISTGVELQGEGEQISLLKGEPISHSGFQVSRVLDRLEVANSQRGTNVLLIKLVANRVINRFRLLHCLPRIQAALVDGGSLKR